MLLIRRKTLFNLRELAFCEKLDCLNIPTSVYHIGLRPIEHIVSISLTGRQIFKVT